MVDLSARRNAFRNGILANAQANAAALLGSQQTAPRVVDVPVVLGGPGAPLTVGAHVFFRLGLNGQATIMTWSLAVTVAGATVSGSVTVDVLVGATMSTLASICSTSLPALVAQAELADRPPGVGWTVTIPDPSWMMVKVTATNGTIEVVSLTLRLSVTPR